MGEKMEAREERHVGIDAGKAMMEVRMIVTTGDDERLIRWHGKTDGRGRGLLCRMLKATDVVAIEAGEPGFTIAREIEERVGAKVLVLNPGKLAMIHRSMRKTDAEDALKLAWLVKWIPEEKLPVVKIPGEDERRRRALVSEDEFYSGTRTRMILRLHSVYVRAGITELEKKDLETSAKRQETLKKLSEKPEYFRKEAERLDAMLAPVEEALDDVDMETRNELRNDELTPILMSASGAGPKLTMAYLAYVGEGKRFDTAAQVSNFVGFVPRIDFSGKLERTGHITKRGCKHIRRLAVQAAWALIRSKEGGALKEKYQELRTRRGKKIAIVAVARKLVELLWVLSQKKELYRYAELDSLERKYRHYGFDFRGSVA
jgi:transposase